MKVPFSLLILLTFLFTTTVLFGQNGGKMSYATYSELKAAGTLPDMQNIEVIYPENVITKGKVGPINMLKSTSNCFAFNPPGSGATSNAVLDDDFFNVGLNFPFCFYGQSYTNVYINDNGNVTFDFASGSFSSTGFPELGPKMIAPFWADFHQGMLGENGLVWYESLPTALIVHYDNVGYFFDEGDKRNTMMLIITDGNDSLLSPENNVGFFYEDMQWTTGDASGGTNGIGGTAATVGVNKGDGTTFIQMGRFDSIGTDYDGAFGNSDGVDWLDNKSFMFNICSSANVPPIIAGFDICDTLYIYVGDTLPIDFSILSGELGQTTQVVIDSSSISNYTVVSNVSGNTANVESYVVGGESNLGLNILSLMAFDNAVPADTTWRDLFIRVDSILFQSSEIGGSSEKEIELKIYPNPFKDYTTLSFSQPLNGDYNLIIYNIIGKEIYSEKNLQGAKVVINRDQLGSGVFLLSLVNNSSNKREYLTKLIVE